VSQPPYRIFETEEDFQAAIEAYIGERVAKLQRAIRRAEKRAVAAEEELVELRRELHSGGTSL
jgi:predicted  nucleic acid-binding Zn-ribbon protein